jgi:hypothetical protein
MESKAKHKYLVIMSELGHRLRLQDAGLFVDLAAGGWYYMHMALVV